MDRHSFPALDHVQLRNHQIPEPPVVNECQNLIQQSHHGGLSFSAYGILIGPALMLCLTVQGDTATFLIRIRHTERRRKQHTENQELLHSASQIEFFLFIWLGSKEARDKVTVYKFITLEDDRTISSGTA